MALDSVGVMGAPAHHLWLGSASSLGRDWDSDLRGVREEQGLQSQDSSLLPMWPLFSVLEVERVKRCMTARRGQKPHIPQFRNEKSI